jgi:hypothetical protein
MPHRLSLLNDKWICGRLGCCVDSSHLQRHCHMQGESFTFHGLQTRWRSVEVDPIAGEIVNPKRYIWCTSYKCFMLNTYSRFCVFDINSRLFKNSDLLHKNYMKELMARVIGNQVVDGHERRTSRFIIRIIDRINFVINNGWGPYLCVLLSAR